jgi:hypothetical protein
MHLKPLKLYNPFTALSNRAIEAVKAVKAVKVKSVKK